ncbi:MAG TPA: glycosyltransferase family 2 protein [Mucilaginibacter sp.]
MLLPNLNLYRSQKTAAGLRLPLPVVNIDSAGLLEKLPAPAAGKTGWPWTEETSPSIHSNHRNWPKVTIVTPSYNQGQFIEQTIRSVLLQNYPNLEYIIIDGGSTDNTKQVLEKYAPFISYLQSEKDSGQSQAINMGFSIASGEYYAWLNSDDYYLKDTLHTVVSKFLSAKVNFIYGYGYNYHIKQQRFELLRVLPLFDYFLRIPSLIQPSCFWAASINQPVWEQLQCSLDYELWLRIVKGQSRLLIKKPLSVAHVHDDAKTHNPKMKAAAEADHQLICAEEVHGVVHNWNRIVFWRRLFQYLYAKTGNY